MNFKESLFTAAIAGIVSYVVVNYEINSATDNFSQLITQNSVDYFKGVEDEIEIKARAGLNKRYDLSFIKARLKGLFPDMAITNIRRITPEFFIATINGEQIAIDNKGDTLLKGKLIDLRNISGKSDLVNAKIHILESINATNNKSRKQPVSTKNLNINRTTSNDTSKFNNSFDYIKSKAIHYPAVGEVKESLILFGDNTCIKCKNLHKSIPSMQESGIEIYYALLSREGLKSSNASKINSILCSLDPKKALDEEFSGVESVESNQCVSPQKDFLYAAINIYKIEGTPTFVNRDGNVVSLNSLL
jgi:hypothetical protein